MTNANSSARVGSEPPLSRPEPRETRGEPRVEPRVEPRAEPRAEARTPPPRASDPKAAEPRSPEVRAPELRVPEPAKRPSVLGPTLRFRGELTAQEDLIIQGSVEGSITHTQSLTIGADGTMKGDIRARVIVIDGKVDGDLFASESVNIRATAKVKGNIFAPRVALQDGAFFQGQVDMQPIRQAAANMPSLEVEAVDQMLSGT